MKTVASYRAAFNREGHRFSRNNPPLPKAENARWAGLALLLFIVISIAWSIAFWLHPFLTAGATIGAGLAIALVRLIAGPPARWH